MKCKKCGKTIIHPDDYGDYDDACEWSCTCTDHFEDATEKESQGFNVPDQFTWNTKEPEEVWEFQEGN